MPAITKAKLAWAPGRGHHQNVTGVRRRLATLLREHSDRRHLLV